MVWECERIRIWPMWHGYDINTVVLVLRRYLAYLRWKMILLLKRCHLTESNWTKNITWEAFSRQASIRILLFFQKARTNTNGFTTNMIFAMALKLLYVMNIRRVFFHLFIIVAEKQVYPWLSSNYPMSWASHIADTTLTGWPVSQSCGNGALKFKQSISEVR